jgi:hypothetical protein
MDQKTPVVISDGALDGYDKNLVGKHLLAYIALPVIQSTEENLISTRPMRSAQGRGGVATFERGEVTNLVDYKMHSVGGVTAEVEVDFERIWHQFSRLAGLPEMFALATPKPNSQRALAEKNALRLTSD